MNLTASTKPAGSQHDASTEGVDGPATPEPTTVEPAIPKGPSGLGSVPVGDHPPGHATLSTQPIAVDQ